MSYADIQKDKEEKIVELARQKEEKNKEIINNLMRHSKGYREALGFLDDTTRLHHVLEIEINVSPSFTIHDGTIDNQGFHKSYFKDGNFFEGRITSWSPNGMVPYFQFSNRGRVRSIIFELYSFSRQKYIDKGYKDRHVCEVLFHEVMYGLPSGPHIFASFLVFKCSDGTPHQCPPSWNQYVYDFVFDKKEYEKYSAHYRKDKPVTSLKMSIVSEVWHQSILKQIPIQWPR